MFDDYLKVDPLLLVEALRDISTILGDSDDTPISGALFCIKHNWEFDVRNKIWSALDRLILVEPVANLHFSTVDDFLRSEVPLLEDLTQTEMKVLIKSFAKTVNLELYEFSQSI
ncbi:hypothetical protein [Vagococcus intermedius]|uniref:Uncharacterized protein n=1 Tax=Vagococcus intermedius TaxID=2991418 RepID=A0AAF0CW80_9ENTE|nr:hypothetical protein [Vagococcus intermedius]WEG73971.1 hypothetical protein OL234_03410 [Vagococcus intermedius]WEG76051.1 hypothetical protein OL235_03415 [Vagococcus intermedius]